MEMFQHKFVKNVPENLDNLVLYISIEYATAIHLCVCGCGHEVVTPLSPTDWSLNFDGCSISLYPSIGNWNLACKSHYWITNSEIHFAEKWNDYQIKQGQLRDKLAKSQYYAIKDQPQLEFEPQQNSFRKKLKFFLGF